MDGRRQREEPVPMAGCDPDFGWVDGADGSGKCYQLIKDVTFAWVNKNLIKGFQNLLDLKDKGRP